MKKIPYGRQDITDEDINSVVSVLTSIWNFFHFPYL